MSNETTTRNLRNEDVRSQLTGQSPTTIIMHPDAPADMKDEARLQLEAQGQKTVDDQDIATLGSEKPGTYDGQNAAHRVINTGRHTEALT